MSSRVPTRGARRHRGTLREDSRITPPTGCGEPYRLAMTRSTQTGGSMHAGAATRVGAGVTPFQTDAEATVRLAQRAEELGYARFGTAEGWTQDAVVVLTRIAGVTSRIRSCHRRAVGLEPTPGAIAMAAAEPPASVGRPLRARPRRRQSTARGGVARPHLAAAPRSHAHHARSGPCAARGRAAPARTRWREAAPAGRLAGAARPDLPRRARARVGPAGRVSSPITGCPSFGPVRGSTTAGPCSPRARRAPRTAV